MTDDNHVGHPKGAPAGNTFAEKHSLYTERDRVFENLDEDEERLFWTLAEDLTERLEGQAGTYELEAIRNICIDVIKRNRANEYLIENFDIESEEVHKVYSRMMRDTTKELKELGLNLQAPEQKEAEAKQNWFEQIKDAQDDE